MLNEIFDRVRSEELEAPDVKVLEHGRVLLRLFLSKAPIVVDELFPLLEEQSKSADFERRWIELFQARVESEKCAVLRDAAACRAAGRDERYHLARLPFLEAKASVISFESLKEYLASPLAAVSGIIECFNNEYRFLNNREDGQEYVTARYLWFVLADLLYERYVAIAGSIELFERKTDAEVQQVYENIGINLAKCDQQFAKYGLLSFDEPFSMSISKQERVILDSRIPQTPCVRIDVASLDLL